MLKFETVLSQSIPLGRNILELTLPYERRTISRQRVTLDDGSEAGLFLPRGTVLSDGDHLQAETGELLKINVANEKVSTLYCEDPLLMARACYHLGNRHVPVQISTGMIRYRHDHVLDEMLKGLNLHVVVGEASFEPEAGAYGGGHSHGEAHVHEHDEPDLPEVQPAEKTAADEDGEGASRWGGDDSALNNARRL